MAHLEERRDITSLEQLRCLTHPLRHRILILFTADEALSVQQMAQRLELPHGKVYYHVRQLVRHGFLAEASQNRINGIVERHYLPAARSFHIAPELSGDPLLRKTRAEACGQLCEQLLAQIRESIDTNGVCSFSAKEIYLTKDEWEGIGRDIDRLIEPYRGRRPGAERVKFWGIFCHDKEGEDCSAKRCSYT